MLAQRKQGRGGWNYRFECHHSYHSYYSYHSTMPRPLTVPSSLSILIQRWRFCPLSAHILTPDSWSVLSSARVFRHETWAEWTDTEGWQCSDDFVTPLVRLVHVNGEGRDTVVRRSVASWPHTHSPVSSLITLLRSTSSGVGERLSCASCITRTLINLSRSRLSCIHPARHQASNVYPRPLPPPSLPYPPHTLR